MPPKDIRAFAARAEELGRGEPVAFLRQVDEINMRGRDRAVQLVVDALGGSVFKKNVTVPGAAFKPHSDDIRDSPAFDVAVRLHGLGACVTITDPKQSTMRAYALKRPESSTPKRDPRPLTRGDTPIGRLTGTTRPGPSTGGPQADGTIG